MILLLLATARPVLGQVELSETMEKQYRFSRDQVLEIKNQYGKVHVNSWEKPQVLVKITIRSKARNRQDAEKRLDEVVIRERILGQKTQLETILPEKEILPQLVRLSSEVNVSYEVYMPRNNPLEIENKFGDVYLSERGANVDVELSYGKLIAEKLDGNNNALKLSFGDSDIAYIGGGDVDYAFGQGLYIGEAASLNLKTNTSSVHIGKVGRLSFSGKMGKLEIDEADLVSGDFNSTLFSVGKLNTSLNMQVKYAPGFKVERVSPNFTSIRLESNFSPIHLRFEKGCTFLLDAEMEYGSMKREGLAPAQLQERKEGNISIYKGKIGNGNPSSKVYIRGKYGSLRLTY